MKIYDCFMLFNEIDLLKIRLEELYDTVDCFVITEATTKHDGAPKPLFFKKYEKEFEKFKDKIKYIAVKNPKLNFLDKLYSWLEGKLKLNIFVILGVLFKFGRWKIDAFQRNQIKKGLKNCKKDDIILVSDLDEIPNKNRIKGIKIMCKKGYLVWLKQVESLYFLNGRTGRVWLGTKAITYRNLKKYFGGNPQQIRYGLKFTFFQKFKFGPKIKFIKNGGWHFSYLGGIKKVMEKIRVLTHTENNTPEINNEENIQKCLEKGKILWDESQRITYTKIDNSFPETIIKNKEKYKNLIYKKPKTSS